MQTKYKFSKSDKIVVLTGAGISAESGLKTFRDNDGLWENHRVEEVATPEAFKSNPALVWKFYKQRYFQLQEVKPNPAHYALKMLEDFSSDNFTLITQNIDGLHSMAGNTNILEMHGSIHRSFCINCHHEYDMRNIDLSIEIPLCNKCGGYLRPDVVWFGEMPYFMELIYNLLQNADFFLVVGTSGIVYPAAQFLNITKMYKAKVIGVNLKVPINVEIMDEFHQGKAGKLLPNLVKIWIK